MCGPAHSLGAELRGGMEEKASRNLKPGNERSTAAKVRYGFSAEPRCSRAMNEPNRSTDKV